MRDLPKENQVQENETNDVSVKESSLGTTIAKAALAMIASVTASALVDKGFDAWMERRRQKATTETQ